MKTEQLIDSLCRDLRPAPGKMGPLLLSGMWCFVSALGVLVFVELALGLRSDLPIARTDLGFAVSTLAALGLLFSASYFAFSAAMPARRIPTAARRLPTLFLVAFLLALFLEALPPGTRFADGLAPAGLACSKIVFLLALLPGLLALFALKRLAPTEPGVTAGAWGLAMGAAGVLGICFHCDSHQAAHLLVYHAVPVIAIALVARLVGSRLLRW